MPALVSPALGSLALICRVSVVGCGTSVTGEVLSRGWNYKPFGRGSVPRKRIRIVVLERGGTGAAIRLRKLGRQSRGAVAGWVATVRRQRAIELLLLGGCSCDPVAIFWNGAVSDGAARCSRAKT